MRATRATLTAVAVAAAIGGCSDAGESTDLPVETLRDPRVVVSTESELIGRVVDLQVGPPDRLHVLDGQMMRVLVVDTLGDRVLEMGGRGGGPGELERPMAMGRGTDAIRVFDAENQRIQLYDAAGARLAERSVVAPELGGAADLSPAGRLAVATGGMDSVLVAVFDSAGEPVAAFGEPVVPPVLFWDFTAMKDRIASGQVPDQFRNMARPVWAADGGLWLALLGEPEVRRYGPDGDRLWRRTLDEPVLDSVRAEFIRRNREETRPSVLYSLRYFRDAEAVDDELWLLLDMPPGSTDALLLVLGPDGEPGRRIRLAGVADGGAFAVDPERRRLYVSRRDDASIVRFDLDPQEGR